MGRVAGRALLGEAAAGIAAGRGRALLIQGEPGVGKSALLEAGLSAVDGRVCTVLLGRCDELSRRLPLSVMMRVLGLDEQSEGQRRAREAAMLCGEVRVAEQVAMGRSNPEIAARLMMSRRTVETHVSHILSTLWIRSRHEVSRSVPRPHGTADLSGPGGEPPGAAVRNTCQKPFPP